MPLFVRFSVNLDCQFINVIRVLNFYTSNLLLDDYDNLLLDDYDINCIFHDTLCIISR